MPKIGLVGSYGWNKNNNNAASFAAGSINSGFSASLNLSRNIFDGAATITRIRNAKVEIETQEFQKKNILLTVTRDFNNIC